MAPSTPLGSFRRLGATVTRLAGINLEFCHDSGHNGPTLLSIFNCQWDLLHANAKYSCMGPPIFCLISEQAEDTRGSTCNQANLEL